MHHLLHRLLICLFVIAPLLCIAQQTAPLTPLIQDARNTTVDTCLPYFQKIYQTPNWHAITNMQIVPGGRGYILAGRVFNVGNIAINNYLLKLSVNGNVQWSNLYILGNSYGIFEEVYPTSDGGFIALGEASWQGKRGTYIVKTDANGGLLWSRYIGHTIDFSQGQSIIETSDGGFAFTGKAFYADNNTLSDVLVIKLDATGALQWSKMYGGDATDSGSCIMQDNDTLIVAGDADVGYPRRNYGILLKINKNNGNLLWSKAYYLNNQALEFTHLRKTARGYAVQATYKNIYYSRGVLEVDYNGNPVYNYQITNPYDQGNYAVNIPTKDGGYIGASSPFNTPHVLTVFKVKNNLVQWKKSFPGPIGIYSMQEHDDGTVVMTGHIGWNYETTLIKISPDGETGCSLAEPTVTISTRNYVIENYAPVMKNGNYTAVPVVPQVIPFNPVQTSLLCATAPCDSIDIQGNSQPCLSGDTLRYLARRGASCRQPVQWTVDPLQATIIATTDSTIFLRLLQAGNVMLRARQQANCRTYLDSLLITVSTPSPVNVGTDRELCLNDSLTITATAGFAQYNWAPNYHISSQQGGAIKVWPSVDTQYIVMATTAAGCRTYDTVRIRVNPSPVIQLGNDTSICQGNNITLHAPVGFNNYQWNNAAITPSINVNTAGLYWLQVTDANGCKARDTLHLSINPLPAVQLGNDTSICQGSSITISTPASFNRYLWSNGANTATVTVNTAGLYWLQVTDANNCTARDSVQLGMNPLPVVQIGNDTSICQGDNITLHAPAGFNDYQWNNGAIAPSINVNSAGLYWVQVTDANNCTARDSLLLSISPLPVVQLGNDTSVCQGSSITLGTPVGFSRYLWSNGATTSTITVNTAGLYWLRATDANGCTARDSLQLGINPLPVVHIGNDTSICQGNSITLGTPVGFNGYLWSNGATTPTITVNTAALYWLRVTDANGCTARDSLQLGINPSPVVQLGNDTSICQGNSIALGTSTSFSHYLWSNGATTPGISVNTTGLYWLRATDTQGCVGRDTVNVTVHNLPFINLGADTVLCAGSSLLLRPGIQFTTYLWQDNATTNSYLATAAGIYWVRVTDRNNCTARDTIQILRIKPQPQNFAPANAAICQLQPLTVSANGNFAQYLWSNGATDNATIITAPGNYWLQVTSTDTCTARENFVVTDKNCSPIIYFPTAFTPNGDGRNDIYRPGIVGKIEYYLLEIFNRAGQRVFYTNNTSTGWDGSYKGLAQNQQTYVWVCTYQFQGQSSVMEKGTLLLIR